MDPNTESRLLPSVTYPKVVYLEALILFFGANYFFHQNIFRANNNKLQFFGFLLANAFTSYNLAEATNIGVARYNAIHYNNALELRHRAMVNQKLRLKLFSNQI